MNKLTIIGNLTRDPNLRSVNTASGAVDVCDFNVAVNGKKRTDESVFFRCTAWRNLAKVIGTNATKGSKVCVIGPVNARTYQANDGTTKVSLEVTVEDFEFCSPKNRVEEPEDEATGMTVVNDEDLPF